MNIYFLYGNNIHTETIKEVIIMKEKRAKQIAASSIMSDVRYNGEPVYIERINANNVTANIHLLDPTPNKQEVSLNDLIEY